MPFVCEEEEGGRVDEGMAVYQDDAERRHQALWHWQHALAGAAWLAWFGLAVIVFIVCVRK